MEVLKKSFIFFQGPQQYKKFSHNPCIYGVFDIFYYDHIRNQLLFFLYKKDISFFIRISH